MDAFLTPSPLNRTGPSNKTSGEEQISSEQSSCQEGSRCTQDNIPTGSLPPIFQEIKDFFCPGTTNGKVKCTICKKEITYSSKSNYNIKSHYDRQHKGEYTNLLAALSGASKRGRLSSGNSDTSPGCPPARKMRQNSIKTAFLDSFDQVKALKLYYNFFIDDIVPLHLTDSPSLRKFLNYISQDFNVPSRRKMSRDIVQLAEEAKDAINDKLANVTFVATTADSWSAHQRSFLGMTVHWIDPISLKRERAVLGIKEIFVKQEATYLAKAMMDLHQEFGLSKKVVSTTTDNGRNYVAAFRLFAGSAEDDNKDKIAEELYEEERDDAVTTVSLEDALVDKGMDDDARRELPMHRRCGAHTVSLMGTADVSEVPGWNYGRNAPFTKTAAKAQALWNCQNRRTVAANQIKDAVGKKLQTPCTTRWNSFFDSCAGLLEVLVDPKKKDELNTIIRKQGLPAFYEGDKDVLIQYCKIMKPVALCLDTLQSEENAFMGILLPNLKLMKDQVASLRNDTTIVEGQHLINSLLENNENPKAAFKGRFQHLFEDMDLLMATALHPHFKLGVVGYLSSASVKEHIKMRVIKEVLSFVGIEEETHDLAESPQEKAEDDPFMYMRGDDKISVATPSRLEEDLEKAIEEWNKVRVMNTTPISSDHFPALHRSAWLNLFLKYNSSLPSSAAVERLFSLGSDILRPKRSSLTGDNFERLVFLKGNLHLLDR